MSSTASITAIAVLFGFVLAPIVIAFDRKRAARLIGPIICVYTLAFVVLALYEISPFHPRETASLSATALVASDERGTARAASAQCIQAVSQSEAAGLILDRRNHDRVVVNGRFWNQMPDQAKEALIYCLEEDRARDEASSPVEIIERNSS